MFKILFFLFTFNAFALPESDIEFCKRLEDKGEITTSSFDHSNLFAFKNDGGILNQGVCWWHSRFQRNSLYLLKLNPHENAPSKSEAKELIKRIRYGNEVLTLNGFQSFNEFTKFYQKEIQHELNQWQLFDGVVMSGWILGLKGTTRINADLLQQKMEELSEYINAEKKLAYVKLQIKGITAHSWLIASIKENSSGFDIGYIDSNWPNQVSLYQYKYGDQSFHTKSYGDFVPYLEFKKEEEKITNTIENYCNRVSF